MTPRQIELVRASWTQVQPVQVQVADWFYARLFELNPRLRALFRGDMQAQGRKLMAALDYVVTGLDCLGERLPEVQALARRHTHYGVQPADYDTVGQALLWTLSKGLDQAPTSEVIVAWQQAYALVAGAMQEAAWPANPAAPEWQAQAS
jgi:hemoglobin-like flavoprotein